MKQLNIATGMLTLCFLLTAELAVAQQRPQDTWGIHKIWGGDELDKLPFVRGGYVAVEWADVNPAPGKFDFSLFDERLAHYAALGKSATVMIRGSEKPDWMFDEIPYHPERLSKQVNNRRGTLQYWHPRFRQRHEELLDAFKKYLDSSPYRSNVYSIRQTLNAVGTEHSGINGKKRERNQWRVPRGEEFVPYSDAESRDYKRWVSQVYYDLFASDYLVFIRSVLLFEDSDALPADVVKAVEEGRVGLLHTSSTPQPESRSTAKKYTVHKRYGRDGATPVYAEPFSSSTKGSRGEQPPAQWNYWRILSDLDAGVTYISVYGSDLKRADNVEYARAFDFGNRYAGYQTGDNAVQSPGAWIALREGANHMQGDYTFLMSRMDGDESDGLDAVGPDTQRYGAWARRIAGGNRLRLEIDERFARAAAGQDMALLVTYFDSRNPRFEIGAEGAPIQAFQGSSSGAWKTVRVPLGNVDFSRNNGADITVYAESDVILHMLELVRTGAEDSEQRPAPPEPPMDVQ